ncbi:Methylthioacryloyl-CoA hydratase [Paraburkholderia domus]|jgi:Enoyl-CoA hydratase/carnithine racemase|uniref:Methylthioacryloyl-CoA hydratase n=2 Tax=Paraburkholderia domus TaxID=2793075 RepID=A0A9N8MRL9_9BURK|nr:crotonase/enoyl-CoA hydratase family protein [Paraburkholderia domus]MBK5048923.1 crotonase/enoyl-CoA hydratase family protein [Burkholderia sp. R-70006]MBK5061366.1 crotonase/enoyl-CoA hydratase family protein [Burkholderia sp. R-70199]MBK5086408.1 crotonase/enoyl-CoA hydratase family protein [Burkholderia sp. R-69927]MBK5120313.1 crotonase/enoyl-CoA hydratase family protein [Burkholderia sp. R-69980]MBK5165754.1 crotonase/enoyl-CoA hydratase family protein [Burkholderia sp. R-70211]MBK51
MTDRLLNVQLNGAVAHVELNRPAKRNALNEALIDALDAAFASFGDDVRAVVLSAAGEHFCAGLDLAENSVRAPVDILRTSQRWHQVFHRIQFSNKPVVAVLQGAVIGGGLELALAAHVRIVEVGAFFQLPEAQRGIFVGGGASVRVARVIGPDRMTEMMLTGRRYSAEDGHRLGLAHYLADAGHGRQMAAQLAEQVAGNSSLSNWAAINAVPRIHDMSMSDGLFTEALTAAVTQSSHDARERMEAFLNGSRS